MATVNYRFICNNKNLDRYDNVKIQNDKIKAMFDISHDNLEECVFQAIMANAIDAATLYGAVDFPTYLTPGEVGCALSHLTVYKEFLDSQFKYIYIFEDDCQINDRLFNQRFIDDVEQFMLKHEGEGTILLLQSARNKQKAKECLGDCKVHKARECYCTHGYVINRQAAKKICEIQNPLKFEIDMFKYYFWLGLAEIYVLETDVVGVLEEVASKSNICSLGSRKLCRSRQKMQYEKYKSIELSLPFKQRMRARTLRLVKNIYKFL